MGEGEEVSIFHWCDVSNLYYEIRCYDCLFTCERVHVFRFCCVWPTITACLDVYQSWLSLQGNHWYVLNNSSLSLTVTIHTCKCLYILVHVHVTHVCLHGRYYVNSQFLCPKNSSIFIEGRKEIKRYGLIVTWLNPNKWITVALCKKTS